MEPDNISPATWGANFTSSLWHSLAISLGTKVNHTATYIPEVNGMVKHLHLYLKAALTTKCQDKRWRKELLWVLLALRTSLHSAFNASPAEALYRQSLAIPADVLQDPAQPTTPSGVRRALGQIMPAKTTYEPARKAYVLEETGLDKFHIYQNRRTSAPLFLPPTLTFTEFYNVETSAIRCQ
ncbi:uncharacterized protein [Macrobrachium rosenbergii]|uniref:uncharacterized protein n=1 Tax=Macrobrachium rosenbergii TaxID=79674 RepID=UPI0034D52E27